MRCRGYEALGYTIVLPASATPGWPSDVPLPAQPAWKLDYAGSVRRLAADGVDASLAGLFVHVARPHAPDAEGADRARSASEAFLYRRLETLPQTRGRFRLNAVLPIAFDGLGQLEVDLLCDDAADTRIAVEIDGDQHLADPAAYRRDRRKDLLLQENGYVVLRFLAQDIGKDLDRVLDTILWVLVRRPRVRNVRRSDECQNPCTPEPSGDDEGSGTMDEFEHRITIEAGKRGGRPCVRGLRITVYDVLGWLAAGMSEREILTDYPELALADIRACLAFAAEREQQVARVVAG